MKAKVLVLALLALLVLAITIVRNSVGTGTLHIDPRATEEIEKAKRR
jgi:hypothetical protein